MSYFLYSGCLPDTVLQRKVINFIDSYYNGSTTIVRPKPELTCLTKHGLEISEAPFNYFGIIPSFGDDESMGGQFVFDQSAGGKLIRLLKFPGQCNETPGYCSPSDRKAEVIVGENVYVKTPHRVAFALLLNIIRLRWCPALHWSDEHDLCSDICEMLWSSGLTRTVMKADVQFDTCCKLMEAEFEYELLWDDPPQSDVEDSPKLSSEGIPLNVLDISLDHLDLSVSTRILLERAGFTKVGQVLGLSRRHFLESGFLKDGSLNDLEEGLGWLGLSLSRE